VKVFQLSSGSSEKSWQQIGSDLNVTSSLFLSLPPPSSLFHTVCISGDGTRAAVSTTTTTNNNSMGYIKVFQENVTTSSEWVQIGKDIISPDFGFHNTDVENSYSQAISMSYDGTRLAIGAVYANFNYTRGKVLVYEFMEGQEEWKEMGSVIENESGYFGHSLSLTDHGDMLAIGIPKGSVGNNNDDIDAGAVEIYEYSANNTWELVTKLLGEHPYEEFGHALSLKDEYLAVGAPKYDSDSELEDVGRVAVFNLTKKGISIPYGTTVEGLNEREKFGYALDISNDGQVLVVGMPGTTDGTSAGGARVLLHGGKNGTWEQAGQDIVGTAPGDGAGYAVSSSQDGSVFIVGTPMSGDGGRHGTVRAYTYPSSITLPQISTQYVNITA